jgi:hypothetical protein
MDNIKPQFRLYEEVYSKTLQSKCVICALKWENNDYWYDVTRYKNALPEKDLVIVNEFRHYQ